MSLDKFVVDRNSLPAELFDLHLTAEDEAKFTVYLRELTAWNAHTNLTAIIAPDEVCIRHFLDSLSVVRVHSLAAGTRLIDVGTGAGFPGLPLAIMFPEIHVTLLESTGKKIAFLDHVIAEMGLTNVSTVKARAEEAGQMPEHRAAYDVVVARAVARLPVLLEYLMPFAKVGGVCVAMKGRTAQQEVDDSAKALATLGGKFQQIDEVNLPNVADPHYLVALEKVAPTPALYPRKPGIPTKTPL